MTGAIKPAVATRSNRHGSKEPEYELFAKSQGRGCPAQGGGHDGERERTSSAYFAAAAFRIGVSRVVSLLMRSPSAFGPRRFAPGGAPVSRRLSYVR
jgi:hypothetical protein